MKTFETRLRTDQKFSLLRPQLKIVAKQNNLKLNTRNGFFSAFAILTKSIKLN